MEAGANFKGAKIPFDNLDANVRYIHDIFSDDKTIISRQFNSPFDPSIRFCLLYADGMVNNKLLNDDIIKPLLEYRFSKEDCPDLIDILQKQVIFSNCVENTDDMEELIQGIVYGDTLLFTEGCGKALILNTKGWNMRSIVEPESERVLRGPREGFNESLLVNLSMLRRKLRTPDLKIKSKVLGQRTQTKICICYLESLANKDVLQELEKRLDTIDIDGILDANYISELIKDYPYSAVKTINSTERPDVVAAKLLEGRAAVFVDGSPVVLTLPGLFIENFQSDEDYYLNYVFASIGRFLRIAAFFLSTSLPAIYISLVTFHQEMLPTPLIISIDAARQGVPFPTALETFIMLVVFEMLRESGARMPGLMGQTLSIVGALVIGTAAVDAKIVSAPIIIIVALTGIDGLMVPRLKGFVILHRFFFMICACILGLYGYLLGVMLMLSGLFKMSSFGVPIMPDVYASEFQNYKDTYARFSWKLMIKRPKFLSEDSYRQPEKKQTGEKKS